MGYGGLIHNFKNYVLRGQAEYQVTFNQQVNRLKYLFTLLMKNLPEDGAGQQQVRQVLSVIGNYEANINLVANAWSSGDRVRDIDRLVRIDDTPAIAALAQLNQLRIFDFPMTEWFCSPTKQQP